MSSYTGPITINGILADAELVVTAEAGMEYVDDAGNVSRRRLYSWHGTLQLLDVGRAPELILQDGIGRCTIAMPDGRTGTAVWKSGDSAGRVEIVGDGPAPWSVEEPA